MLEPFPPSDILGQPSTKMRFSQLKLACLLLWGACASCQGAPDVVQTGKIDDPRITESSGVVASRQHPKVLWTHNDGGKKETLFAITREGKTLAEFRIAGAKLEDWEDIAIDNEGHLYLADTGDNGAKRKSIAVY